MYHLVVVSPFGQYKKGDKITDPQKVSEVLSSEQSDSVVKIPIQEEE